MSKDEQRLTPLRAKIDEIDTQLLELLTKRAKAAQEVGHIKNESSAPIFRPERENQVIQNVLQKNSGPLLADGIASIWREIMSACRALESRQTVAYLGPVGTFSELAAHQCLGQSVQRGGIADSSSPIKQDRKFGWYQDGLCSRASISPVSAMVECACPSLTSPSGQ